MFVTRLLSGIVLVILAGVTIGFGNYVLFGTTLLISIVGMTELYKILHVDNKLIGFAGYAAAAGYYALLFVQKEQYFLYLCMGFLILVMAIYVLTFPRYQTDQILLVFFGFFYVAVMLAHLYKTRMLEHGGYIVWLIFLSSWVCDTFAYCVGMLCNKTLGTHKLAPKLSPKKSIEGAVGGVAGSLLLGMLYGYLAGQHMEGITSPALTLGLICGAGAVISQIGDLAASAIKRNYEIKDYGKLIPGHGGILDRFDSVIFTAPIIYFLAEIMM